MMKFQVFDINRNGAMPQSLRIYILFLSYVRYNMIAALIEDKEDQTQLQSAVAKLGLEKQRFLYESNRFALPQQLSFAPSLTDQVRSTCDESWNWRVTPDFFATALRRCVLAVKEHHRFIFLIPQSADFRWKLLS
jgi:hypothetical protein